MRDYRREVDEMEPGRDLDMEVAEYALGWHDISHDMGGKYMALPPPPFDKPAQVVPNFSTDPQAAQQVVDTLGEIGIAYGSPFQFKLFPPGAHPRGTDPSKRDQWYAVFTRKEQPEDYVSKGEGSAYGKTEAEAISKAALKAVWDASENTVS